MNPESKAPISRQEVQPVNQGAGEAVPIPEVAGEASHETERSPVPGEGNAAPVPDPSMYASSNVVPALPTVQQSSDDTAGPTIANDDDLIEKEWVDKAKKIIRDTQNDPHKREEEVTKLQIDYLRKRYNKELGTSN
jgi:hypothetical protein